VSNITTILIWDFDPETLVQPMEFRSYIVYSWDIRYQSLEDVILTRLEVFTYGFFLFDRRTWPLSMFDSRTRKHRCSRWNFVAIWLAYKQRYTQSKFRDRHLQFFTFGFFPFDRTTLPLSSFDSLTPKHWYSRWNFVAILCTSWDIRNQSLGATIFNFPLLVFSSLTVEHYHYYYLIIGLRKHRYSGWNSVAILCTSWYIRNPSLEAAILNFPLPVSSRLTVQ